MKIGLYLQDRRDDRRIKRQYKADMKLASKSGIDLLVFPEHCYTPFSNTLEQYALTANKSIDLIYNYCLDLSRSLHCAVIFGGKDRAGFLYSAYANAYAEADETKTKIYVKHTAASASAFDLINYPERIGGMFKPITLKGMRIGMTICYDCNHAAFSRAYGILGIDLLINVTGGNVQQRKWYRYNKVRAIENNCISLCTMSYFPSSRLDSYVFGFSEKGRLLTPTPLKSVRNEWDTVGNIFIYDTKITNNNSEPDISLSQTETTNKYESCFVESHDIGAMLSDTQKIVDNLFETQVYDQHLIFCVVDGIDILRPEVVLPLLYSKALEHLQNRKYLIINHWDSLDANLFDTAISDVLKVRAMENYCAVLLQSPNINRCYQCGKNRTVQVVKERNGHYGLDLERMGGPEVIWRNKVGMMKASWRVGYESLISFLNCEVSR